MVWVYMVWFTKRFRTCVIVFFIGTFLLLLLLLLFFPTFFFSFFLLGFCVRLGGTTTRCSRVEKLSDPLPDMFLERQIRQGR